MDFPTEKHIFFPEFLVFGRASDPSSSVGFSALFDWEAKESPWFLRGIVVRPYLVKTTAS